VSEDKVFNSFDTREYVKDSFMMGLRLTNGINIKKLKKIREFSLNQETLDELNDEDLILSNLSNIKLTQKGFNIADYIIFKLIESINFKVA
jgi:coproporphyrinogen III oxidase-like Fe-S oxidoreductase